jgi:hypothetical protein
MDATKYATKHVTKPSVVIPKKLTVSHKSVHTVASGAKDFSTHTDSESDSDSGSDSESETDHLTHNLFIAGVAVIVFILLMVLLLWYLKKGKNGNKIVYTHSPLA